MHEDICTLDARNMRVDVVTMGLLCQAFSLAGNGLGFADPKLAEAYRHAMRVLGEIDAKVIIIECARRFMTLDDGEHSDTLIEHLMQMGYRVQHRALDAAAFGVAQSRERSFLVCTRIGVNVDPILGYVFPEEQEPSATVADIMECDLPATILESEIVLNSEKRPRRSGLRQTVGLIGARNSQGYRVYCPQSGPGATLTASGGGRAAFTGAYRVKGGARPLTPREACRMQGLPEWAEHHPERRDALRHAGNAVAVPVACALIEQLGAVLGCPL
jgi:DNA (cytosine-5)-methyltransferase 1